MCHKCGSTVIHVTTRDVNIQNVPIRIALWSYHTWRQRQNELSPLKKWVDDCTNLIYIQADEINYHFFSVFKLPKFLCTLDICLGINLLHQSFFASHILTMHDNITPIQYNQKAIVWRMSVSLNAHNVWQLKNSRFFQSHFYSRHHNLNVISAGLAVIHCRSWRRDFIGWFWVGWSHGVVILISL